MEKRIILGLLLCAILVWTTYILTGEETPRKGDLPPVLCDTWRSADPLFENRYLELGQNYFVIGLPTEAKRHTIDALEIEASGTETLYTLYYDLDGDLIPLSFRHIPGNDEIRLYEKPGASWKRERVLRAEIEEQLRAEREKTARKLEEDLNEAIFGEDPVVVEDGSQ